MQGDSQEVLARHHMIDVHAQEAIMTRVVNQLQLPINGSSRDSDANEADS
jgi:hypothetical protein